MRIIAEQSANHWNAWNINNPQIAFGGNTSAAALGRLTEALGIEAVQGDSVKRLAFVVKPIPCPACFGSGYYTGLQSVETCETCGGSGRV